MDDRSGPPNDTHSPEDPAGGPPLTLAPSGGAKHRWLQLLAGIAAMVAIANMQYGWTLFVDPIQERFHWSEAAIQVAFTLFVLSETWLVPVESYLVDRIGPRPVVAAGGVLVALAWMLNATATTLAAFYVNAVIGGIGAGAVYGTAVGNALKWFPDRRGLAAGLTAAAFGAGSALTVSPIAAHIKGQGYASAFLWFGLVQGVVVLAAALLLRAPRPGELPEPRGPGCRKHQRTPDTTPKEMLKAPVFWLLYAMFTMVAMGGLMATAQIGPMARHFKVAEMPVHLFGITMAALPFALSLDRILNGISRPLFGWISDHLGRERTMCLAFGLEGLGILLLVHLAHHPLLFVLLTGLAFLAWGEIYSLFPALSGDLFGRKYACTNYGLLYTAKGTAALMVPLGSLIQQSTGSWKPVFFAAAALDWTAALLAWFVLRPLCARFLDRPES